MIKVGVVGALGKMGKEVIKTILNEQDTQLVAAIDIHCEGEDISEIISGKKCGVLIDVDIENSIISKKPDVIIDFTQPDGIFNHVCTYIKHNIKSVIGTTGLTEEQIVQLREMSNKNNTACLIAPNFSTGAVLMMMFAKQAAKYFNNAEIIELHHNQKKDAPSGTAIKTAKLMAEVNPDLTCGNCRETELLQGARGAKSDSNIHIHSVRMPGYIASQEVLFGAPGQIFKIKHDTMDRSCYMAGVMLAVRHVYNNSEFIYGLDNIM
ncbi:MAG: 4-hydroxy-tetrahydrodipicolinate reductase [Candidatus Gastranaerophilales bacterium]|nr:4-hydroxy-tetrahydrodipicolinate reductase [Candidatus Gastranaerophilales bacterium]